VQQIPTNGTISASNGLQERKPTPVLPTSAANGFVSGAALNLRVWVSLFGGLLLRPTLLTLEIVATRAAFAIVRLVSAIPLNLSLRFSDCRGRESRSARLAALAPE
jgi:hypothetical protein